MSTFIGIDPGKTGGMACIQGSHIHTCKLDETERDVSDWIRTWSAFDRVFAMIERVASSPQMGVTSSFTFGRGYGFVRGCLIVAAIPFEEVSPQKWQKVMGCLSKGDKNVTKSKAQQLFPSVKMSHAIADAILIAEYCRRIRTNTL